MIQDFYVVSATDQKPTALVLILHGYGANGKNLLFLADYWKRKFPKCLFIIPNAPEAMPETMGYKWFEIGDLSSQYLDKGVDSTAPSIAQFVRNLQKAYDIPPEKTIISGFSQGAMLALATGLTASPRICAGILAYSGGLYLKDKAPQAYIKEVGLIHGDRDLVVSKTESERAYKHLSEQSIPTSLHILKNLEHQINAEGVQLGQALIERVLK